MEGRNLFIILAIAAIVSGIVGVALAASETTPGVSAAEGKDALAGRSPLEPPSQETRPIVIDVVESQEPVWRPERNIVQVTLKKPPVMAIPDELAASTHIKSAHRVVSHDTFSELGSCSQVIYDNTTEQGYWYHPGASYELLDYGTSGGGTVCKFSYAYVTTLLDPGTVTVRFYSGTTSSTCPGSFLAVWNFSGLMGSPDGNPYGYDYDFTIPSGQEFNLPSGSFGYSYEFDNADTGVSLATGGSGNENTCWEDCELFWFGGDPWAGFYMKVTAEEDGVCPGDTCATAMVIGALPFSDTGDTCGCTDDYDEVCPYSGSTSPDTVYSYTPASNTEIDIFLCDSTYDTKVYVYEGSCLGTLVDCNDDVCGSDGYKSQLLSVSLTAGNTYYIIVDGYAGDCGSYTIDVVGEAYPDIRIEPLTLNFSPSAAPPAVKQPVIASPDYFTFLQPNGISFRARKFGDEFYHWMETDAGWTIAWNPAGKRYEYVDVDVNGKFEFTGLMVGVDDPLVAGIPKHVREAPEIVEKRQTRAMQSIIEEAVPDQALSVPPTGTVTSLVILANFSDTNTTYSQADFNGLFNTIGYNQHGANGSVRDYYTEASYGNLLVDTTVSQWVTLPNTKAYYGANDGSGNDIRPREMIEDAIAALDAAGFDFAPFDADADGWIDSFSVIHQGPGEEAGGGADCIWSHAWAITSVQVDGIWISQYHTEPETYGGGLTTIGVICHEFGHALGLPDLYDTDYSSEGIGKWGVMASGSWNNSGIRPGHFCSWSKIQLGWVSPTLLNSSQTGINIARLSANAQAYKITSGMASDEYLLVENRQTSGNDFDDSLPGDGLLVYHIDDNKSNNRDETHYMVGVLQADGLWDLENNINRGDAGDPFPGSTNNRYLGPDSNPDTDSYYNGDTGIVISNISNSGDPMSFNFGGQSFTIYNDGAGTLSVNSITPESAADWISWGPQAPFDVAPGEYQVVTVSVDFNQAPCKETTTRLLVYSNDPNEDESPYPGGVYIVVTNASCCGDWCYYEADFNQDCYVNLWDLSIFAASWLWCECAPANNWCAGTDMDQNGCVTFTDFAIFASQCFLCTDLQGPGCDNLCP